MKKIRIDYYNYRLKKGRADILLQFDGETGEYCIPFHYVKAKEHLHLSKGYYAEDDGDLVLIEQDINNCHLKKTDKVWVPLKQISELTVHGNDWLHVSHHIFTYFLQLCPREGESGIIDSVINLLESVKVEIAKKEYVAKLRSVLEGESLIVLDANVKQPDPELIRKEMETLEHFRLRKPHDTPMCQLDGYLLDNDLYTYAPIDWEALGAEIRPTPRVQNPLFDKTLEDLYEEQ